MQPILLDFPERIETERLYIRSCLPGDGKVVHDAIQHSREDLRKWMPFAQNEQTVEEVEEGIRRSYSNFILREDFRLHIYKKENDTFVGSTGFHRINWDVRKFEIGYWCDSRHQKNGYMTEAVKALTEFLFNSLRATRVEIRCDSKNVNSRNIPERLGFTLEGILQMDILSANGLELRDNCVFAKVRA